MSLSKSQYLVALQEKLSVQLPLGERRVQKEIEKLEAALVDIENEKRIVKAEIDFLLKDVQATKETSKSLLDIPHAIWIRIKKILEGREFVLHNACLSSVDIEQAVTGGSAREKLRLLGERVVSVMLMNYYLNVNDLWTFLQTTSRDLQMFAGANWWCVFKIMSPTSRYFEEITFKHPEDIWHFKDKALKASNKWLFFTGHQFKFDSTEISTAAEYKLFWETAVLFLRKFGTFLLYLSVEFNSEFCCNDRILNFCTDLLRIIPKIRRFDCDCSTPEFHEISSVTFNTKTNNRTIEPYLSINGDWVAVRNAAWFESLRQNSLSWKIYSQELEDFQQVDTGFLDKTQELIVYVQLSTKTGSLEEGYMNLLYADFLILQNIKKLVLDGSSYDWKSLLLLTKFSKATELVLSGHPFRRENDFDYNTQEHPFPAITKLTINIDYSMPLRLDILPTVLPSLRHLCLKQKCNNLQQTLKQWDKYEVLNAHIDVYRLIVANRSLKESNIWNEMGGLKLLCVERIVKNCYFIHRLRENEHCYERKQKEIYTRNEDGSIRFDQILNYN